MSEAPPKTPSRKKLTALDKLKVMVRDARCELCGGKLLSLDQVEFDHRISLALGGDDSIENLRAVHSDCHAVKTFGTPATTAGSDAHARAKIKRLSKEQEAFRLRMLAKGEPEQEEKPRPKSRKFPKGRGFSKRKKEKKPWTATYSP